MLKFKHTLKANRLYAAYKNFDIPLQRLCQQEFFGLNLEDRINLIQFVHAQFEKKSLHGSASMLMEDYRTELIKPLYDSYRGFAYIQPTEPQLVRCAADRIVCVGGLGANFLSSDATQDFDNSISWSLFFAAKDRRFFQGPQQVQPGQRLQRDEQMGFQDFDHLELQYRSNTVALVAGLGGTRATPTTCALARCLSNSAKKLHCVVTTPFDFEGPDRAARAQAALIELKSLPVNVMVLNNNDLFQGTTDETTFTNDFKVVGAAIIKVLFTLPA